MITATKEQLEQAFQLWVDGYIANPHLFIEGYDGTYASDCAEYLIELLNVSY